MLSPIFYVELCVFFLNIFIETYQQQNKKKQQQKNEQNLESLLVLFQHTSL